jgi:CrcB protein
VSPLVVLAVVLAGGTAAVVRAAVSAMFASHRGFPWAVLVVNVVGSGIGGAVLGLAERSAVTSDLAIVLLTGLCGGLTTFSTLNVETVQLVHDRRTGTAVASVAGNLALGVAIAALAYLALR